MAIAIDLLSRIDRRARIAARLAHLSLALCLLSLMLSGLYVGFDICIQSFRFSGPTHAAASNLWLRAAQLCFALAWVVSLAAIWQSLRYLGQYRRYKNYILQDRGIALRAMVPGILLTSLQLLALVLYLADDSPGLRTARARDDMVGQVERHICWLVELRNGWPRTLADVFEPSGSEPIQNIVGTIHRPQLPIVELRDMVRRRDPRLPARIEELSDVVWLGGSRRMARFMLGSSEIILLHTKPFEGNVAIGYADEHVEWVPATELPKKLARSDALLHSSGRE